MSEKDFDLICIGRSCVDLYSGEFGVPLERAMTFTKSVGGSPMNIAIGTSRLGLRVGAITGVGQEDNGRYLKWQLSCEGVDVSAVKTDPKRLTAMVLLSIRGDNDFPLIQYRENCADMGLTAEDIDPDYLARAGAVLVTGTHLSRGGVRSATMKVLETAKRLGLKCILDIDFRPNLWGLQGHDAGSSRWAEASEQVTSEYKKVLPYFDLIVGTEEEFFIAGIKIIGSFIILCGVNVWLTLIMFTIVPFIVLAAVYFNRKMKEQFRIQRVQLGEINAQVEDSLLGVRVVKSFANEELEKEKFEKGNQIFYNVKRHRYFYMGGFEASNRLFDGLMNLLVLVAGAVWPLAFRPMSKWGKRKK